MSDLPLELRINNDPIDTGDRLVAAYPKTGRTWLRFMMGNYLLQLADVNQEVDFQNVYSVVPNTLSGQVPGQPEFDQSLGIPKVIFTHETPNPDKTYPDETIYITRDPRDVMVSNWFHRTKQLGQYDGSLQDFIHDEQWGIDSFVNHADSWLATVGQERVIRYESLKLDTVATFLSACRLLDLVVSDDKAATAVEAASFGRMQAIEDRGRVVGHNYDATDPNARRVRSGKVGGFRDYLNADDLRYIAERMDEGSGLVGQFYTLED